MDEDLYERKQLKSFNQAKLIQFREDRAAFSDAKFKALFERWKVEGNQVVMGELQPETCADSFAKSDFQECLCLFKQGLLG